MELVGLDNLTERWRRSKIRHEVFSQSTLTEILEERGLSVPVAVRARVDV